MTVRVLVVDDSGFFRRRLSEILNADPRLEVIGAAVDGKDALEKTQQLRPDVITMDIEMPVMDGITAVRKIMATRPTPILMFSSLTFEGAQATLDALDAGALDFLPKRFEDIARDREEGKQTLRDRVVAIARRPLSSVRPAAVPRRPVAPLSRPVPAVTTPTVASHPPLAARRRGSYQLVAIGTSTGGPVALQEVLTKLPGSFPLPLLLIQHMPASFTAAFAQRLNQLCAIEVREAADGDELRPALALLAPGGRQMVVERVAGRHLVRITDSEPDQHYRPCVDITFRSAAKLFPGRVLSVILTGMGADGREGARELKAGGSTVWAQDEATSVVYGMPMAVKEAGLTDRVLPLQEVGPNLAESV
ncbi:protein-glutamate methylesterase/protein-glutamine glutaminase [Endothiovibrio diazotrophicus]